MRRGECDTHPDRGLDPALSDLDKTYSQGVELDIDP
jgi:hypothetical protein